ncbi:hypothetical protein MIND_00563300 [Mycena indigotica]|uniref:Uncharacterized protein n=1 Tax=Mycena indigotica TaxID=2126181 RepID=A0A8H6SSX0_9AGAR|nr:uncharacterized protein MIND_00563300 [Mycena indigotica]KAF7303355.1 hypothetical protein MIND_00563300 [Mycena indigotica]
MVLLPMSQSIDTLPSQLDNGLSKTSSSKSSVTHTLPTTAIPGEAEPQQPNSEPMLAEKAPERSPRITLRLPSLSRLIDARPKKALPTRVVIGKQPSKRREQSLAKAEREREQREDNDDKRTKVKQSTLFQSFAKSTHSKPRVIELSSDSEAGSDGDLDKDSQPVVNVEQIRDEEMDKPIEDEYWCEDVMILDGNELEEEHVEGLGSQSVFGERGLSCPIPSATFDNEADATPITTPVKVGEAEEKSDGEGNPRETRRKVTVEEIEDDYEGGAEITTEPAQLSAQERAEEGLDDEPWDPSQEVHPHALYPPATPAEVLATSPQQPPSPPQHSEPLAYPHSQHGFTMPNRTKPRQVPAQIPSNNAVVDAIQNLEDLLRPRRRNGTGRIRAKLDLVIQARLEAVQRFLRLYRAAGFKGWTTQSELIARAGGKMGAQTWLGRKLREWSIAFCKDKKNIPSHKYGRFSASMLSDEDIAADIHLHLQSLGKWVSAKQIVRYVRTPEFQARLRVKRDISVRTAQNWMHKMGYRWRKEPKGMYSDGHERADVVDYRQNVFLPKWREIEARSRWWTPDATFDTVDFECRQRLFLSKEVDVRPNTTWRQDESTFYANDRRTLRWVHESETATLKAKGEGASDMIGDFVSPEYGWLRSKKLNAAGESEDARVLLKPGKNREGYQTTTTILAQVTRAMDILDRDYAHDRHTFAYDNATIHTARAPDALSAIDMTLGPSQNFNKVKGPDGVARCVRMRDARFKDGTPQSLYNADGVFKGLKSLIQERRAKAQASSAEAQLTHAAASAK